MDREDVYIATIERLYGLKFILCEYHKNQIYLGVYDASQRSFVNTLISDIVNIKPSTVRMLSESINTISSRILKGWYNPTYYDMKDDIYNEWIDYKNKIEQSPVEKVNNTLDAKYIINKDNAINVIHTAQELKDALPSEEPQFKR